MAAVRQEAEDGARSPLVVVKRASLCFQVCHAAPRLKCVRHFAKDFATSTSSAQSWTDRRVAVRHQPGAGPPYVFCS